MSISLLDYGRVWVVRPLFQTIMVDNHFYISLLLIVGDSLCLHSKIFVLSLHYYRSLKFLHVRDPVSLN